MQLNCFLFHKKYWQKGVFAFSIRNRTHIFIFQFSESDHTLSHSLTGPGGKLPLPLRAPGLLERDSPSRPRPASCRRKKGGGKLPLPLRAPGLSERDSPSRPRPGFLKTQEGRRQAAAPTSRSWSLGKGQPRPPAPRLFADARRAAASCRSHFAPLVSRKGTAQAARALAFCRRKKGGTCVPPPLLEKGDL